jgi:predicted ATP-dependent Lon-type protease
MLVKGKLGILLLDWLWTTYIGQVEIWDLVALHVVSELTFENCKV